MDLSAPVPPGRPYPAGLPPEPGRNPRLRCPRCAAAAQNMARRAEKLLSGLDEVGMCDMVALV
ncbi:hypothetical protein ACWDE9_22330, partial [Streptomyces olivaceoviridis]